MPRNGSGVYSLPGGSTIINGQTSDASDINGPLADLVTDANTARPIVAGGTGATSAASALTNLGLTATAAELNILDGATVTVTEVNRLSGVTSDIQTQFDNLAPSLVPAGAVIWHTANTAPTGYLKANGAAVSRTTYADLFAAIGTTYGVGDGSTTFNLPDLRGEFVRGWDDSRGIDSGRAFASAQSDAIRNITGSFRIHGDAATPVTGAFAITRDVVLATWGAGTGDTDTVSFDASTQVPTAAENRPRNIALLACIKY